MAIEQVPLREELVEQIHRIASDESIEKFVDKAVQERIERVRSQQIDEEIAAYEQMHAALAQKYLGKWVAVAHGEIAGVADDFEPLFLEIREKFGERGVLIRRVTQEVTPVFRAPSPRLER